MEYKIFDKNILKSIHGYVSCSDEDSDFESKEVFDEFYENFKPPPIFIDPKIHKIIEIGPDPLPAIKTQPLSYSSVVKKSMKSNASIESNDDESSEKNYDNSNPSPILVDSKIHKITEIEPDHLPALKTHLSHSSDVNKTIKSSASEGNNDEENEKEMNKENNKNNNITEGKKKINKKRKKKKSPLCIEDSIGYYTSYFAYEGPDFQHYVSFKENYLNGPIDHQEKIDKKPKPKAVNDYLGKIQTFLKNYENQVNIFVNTSPLNSFRVLTATQIFLKSMERLEVKQNGLIFNCSMISDTASIFENFVKQERQSISDFSSEKHCDFNTVMENLVIKFDPVVQHINKYLTDILENFVKKCKLCINPEEKFECYSNFKIVNRFEKLLKCFEEL